MAVIVAVVASSCPSKKIPKSSNDFEMLKFESNLQLRNRLVLSTLSGKPIRIDNIRTEEDDVGLKGIIYPVF